MDELMRILQELDEILRRQGLGFSLTPPLRRHELDDLLAQLPFALPSELLSLYRWKNGENGPPSVTEEFTILPLEHVVEQVATIGHLYRPGWLPVLSNGGGDFIYIDAQSGRRGPLMLWRVYDRIENGPLFDSVASLVSTLLQAHRERVFSLSQHRAEVLADDGTYHTEEWRTVIVRHPRKWAIIQRTLNPKSWDHRKR